MLGAQTHGDRVALLSGTFVLGLGSSWGHLGPFQAGLAPFGPILASKGPFWPFLAVMRPSTNAARELGAQTHGDRVALHSGIIVPGLGSLWGHLGPFWAILSSNVAVDRRHLGVEGPNTW